MKLVHMPVAQLAKSIIRAKTETVTRPTSSAYSTREAPRSSRARRFRKAFNPTPTLAAQCPFGSHNARA